jgi:hemoglobin
MKEKANRSDIQNSEDVKRFVQEFYDLVNRDPILSPIFNDVAKVDWTTHLPLLNTFWNTLLFRSGEYKGNPFSKHLLLPVGQEHFGRWVDLFITTIDSQFAGPKAEEAKNYARSIAETFRTRMGLGSPYNAVPRFDKDKTG